MAKIVTTFFADDGKADEFLALIKEDYYSFVETVTEKRIDRVINYRRYQKAKRNE